MKTGPGASGIIGRLTAADSSWHPKTAKTLLARLVQKRVLGYESQGRRYVYEPLVTERECVAAVSDSFLDRVFGGSLKPMFAHCVTSRRLTKEELEELKQLLETETQKERQS